MSEPRLTVSARPRSGALTRLTHPLAVGALALAAAGYLAVFDPSRPGHYPTCPILLLTGYYCPGCGGLRALHDLIHGDLLAALSSNLLVVLAVPVVVALWVDWIRNRLSGRASRLRSPAWLPWVLLVVLLAFGGLRNLPQMQWLAP
jgi:hypothetical protein